MIEIKLRWNTGLRAERQAFRWLLFLAVLLIYATNGQGTVSLSASYYNSDGGLSEEVSVDNADFQGSVVIMPYETLPDFPSSITLQGAGHSNGAYSRSYFSHSVSASSGGEFNEIEADMSTKNASFGWTSEGKISSDYEDGQLISLNPKGEIVSGVIDAHYANSFSSLEQDIYATNKYYAFNAEITSDLVYFEVPTLHPIGGSEPSQLISQLTATNHGKEVVAFQKLQEDPLIRTVVPTEWYQEVKLGPQESQILQYVEIRSIPGYLTYPTSELTESITAGMTLEATYENSGQPLFEKRFIPTSEFSNYPLTVGVMKNEYDDVYMVNRLNMSVRWGEQTWEA